MRLLFATTAGAGHFGPLIPFARGAVGLGHDVIVAAPSMFESSVIDAGFDFRPLGERPEAEREAMFGRMYRASFDEANTIMIRDGFAGIYARAALPSMLDLIREWRPDRVIRESLEFASLAAAEALGTVHVQVATGLFSTLDSDIRPARAAVRDLLSAAGVATDRLDEALDESVLTLTPPSLDQAVDRSRGMRYRAADPPPLRVDSTGRPLVFLTFGSEAGSQRFFPETYRAAIDSIADGSVELLVTVGMAGDPAALEPLPSGVRVERWVDQAEVLRHASVTVCHGGYGTVIGSLAAGTPLVIVPLFSQDQWRNAARIAEVGAGLALDGPDGVAGLGAAVRRVLNEPEFGDRANALSREVASLPPARDAIKWLETRAAGLA
jgi:UDP:flavonoid glycosyltransferase YjiC (YdhE family)